MSARSEVCAVAVTFHPDAGVAENLRAMAAECGRVFVVDNGSTAEVHAAVAAVAGTELIALGENLGIAEALNIGLRRARAEGYRWAVTFDQDSTPQSGMVAALRATAQWYPQAAVIVPDICEADGARYRWLRPQRRLHWFFERVTCDAGDLPAVTMAVSSGAMIETETWERIGGFEGGFFIDYVDIDYCLRVIRSGRTVTVSAGARLNHRLGAREKGEVLGHAFRPTHHAAFRHYYIARNRVHAWRRHAFAAPHWAMFDLCFAAYNLVRVLALEPAKAQKTKAMLLGTWDGFRGKTGRCPARREPAPAS